jgi:hypothetical protein
LEEIRRADEAAAGVPKAKQGCGAASEVALARRESLHETVNIWDSRKPLVHEMPHTLTTSKNHRAGRSLLVTTRRAPYS